MLSGALVCRESLFFALFIVTLFLLGIFFGDKALRNGLSKIAAPLKKSPISLTHYPESP